jgi:hypothetical protein
VSAFLIVQRQDRIDLFTDGMQATIEGVVVGFPRKVFHLDNGVGVVFGRGSLELFAGIAEHANLAGWSFDQTVEAIPCIAPGQRAAIERRTGWSIDQNEIAIAGWSDARQQFEAYLLPDTDLHDSNGMPSGTLSLIPPFYAGPPADEGYIEALGWARQGLEVGFWRQVQGYLLGDGFDPRRDGLAFMEGQRLTPVSEGDQGEVGTFVVGGFALWTEITRDGARDQVLRIWPDRIGERITPEPFMAPAD